MKALENKIIKEGTVLPGHILKVGSFLNQRIDTVFIDLPKPIELTWDVGLDPFSHRRKKSFNILQIYVIIVLNAI